MVAAALIGSAVIAGGTAAAAGAAQSRAAGRAANTSSRAAASDRALQWSMYQRQRADFDRYYGKARGDLNTGFSQAIGRLAPYDDPGPAATNRLAALAGVQGGQAQLAALQSDPGYQFRLQQGTQAVDRGAAARGMLMSGANQKALTEFGQGLASSELNNAYNRTAGVADAARTTATNMADLYRGKGQALANLATGQGTQLGNLATNTTNAVQNINQNNLQNQVAANTAQGQARASAYTGVGNAANNAMGNYLFYTGMQNGWFGGQQ